jgi:hypothetical protein
MFRLTMRLSVLVNDWHPQMPCTQDEWESFVNSDTIKARIEEFAQWELKTTSKTTQLYNGENVYLTIVNDFIL